MMPILLLSKPLELDLGRVTQDILEHFPVDNGLMFTDVYLHRLLKDYFVCLYSYTVFTK